MHLTTPARVRSSRFRSRLRAIATRSPFRRARRTTATAKAACVAVVGAAGLVAAPAADGLWLGAGVGAGAAAAKAMPAGTTPSVSVAAELGHRQLERQLLQRRPERERLRREALRPTRKPAARRGELQRRCLGHELRGERRSSRRVEVSVVPAQGNWRGTQGPQSSTVVVLQGHRPDRRWCRGDDL
jgi:hypothetical protein